MFWSIALCCSNVCPNPVAGGLALASRWNAETLSINVAACQANPAAAARATGDACTVENVVAEISPGPRASTSGPDCPWPMPCNELRRISSGPSLYTSDGVWLTPSARSTRCALIRESTSRPVLAIATCGETVVASSISSRA
jgi:hypothetical protein